MRVRDLSFELIKPPHYFKNGPHSNGPCQFMNQDIEVPEVGDIVHLPIEEAEATFVVVTREFYYIRESLVSVNPNVRTSLTANVGLRHATTGDWA